MLRVRPSQIKSGMEVLAITPTIGHEFSVYTLTVKVAILEKGKRGFTVYPEKGTVQRLLMDRPESRPPAQNLTFNENTTFYRSY